MPKLSALLQGVPTRQKSVIGVMMMSLLLQACASTQLSQPVKVVTIDQDCPRLSISPDLLLVRPLTPVPPIKKNGSLEDAMEIVAADHARDRGQLKGLTAAEKQRAADQAVIDKQCADNVTAQKEAIEAASQEQVRVRVPIWKRLGL